ncbi:hypothetical protein PENDEC_c008G03754 [Penicillium decumbens]|uniref:BZIP domain-containing protein n=1 Tax=Penicillium decumbens TaxID=69771 RepID=A0A1V6PDL1_PENDC|nr:hypothetical protein PENDEC_c008G03754 [Penicillium decumbens]
MAEKSQKDFDRLARVRENQRKSRARKQEHTRDLEQQLAACKKQAQQKDIEYRLALQKMHAENRNLRTLLGSLGISAELIQQYVIVADQDTSVTRKVAIPAVQRSKKPSAPSSATRSSSLSRTPVGDQTVVEKPPVDHGAYTLSEPQPTEQHLPQKLQSPDPPLCCPPGSGQGNSNTWPGTPDDDMLNTTMCAIADELI